MITLLYGKDNYRLLQKKQLTEDKLAATDKKVNTAEFDFSEEGEIDACKQFLSSQSLFAERKLAIVRSPYKNNFAEIAKGFLENSTANLLLIAEKKPPKKFSFLLKKPAEVEAFPELSKKEIKSFIEKEARQRGVRLSADAVFHLEKVYGKDSWAIATELDKLANFDKQEIGASELSAMGVDASPAFFGLLQQVKKRPPVSLVALSRLFVAGEDAGKLFNILSVLWPAKAREFAKHDLAIKSGNWELEEALLDLALKG